MKYRKKPVVIEALQYLREENIAACMDFCPDMIYNHDDNEYEIETLEGNMRVSKGDYIIKGIKDEFYPCKPDIFEATYDKVNDGKSLHPMAGKPFPKLNLGGIINESSENRNK